MSQGPSPKKNPKNPQSGQTARAYTPTDGILDQWKRERPDLDCAPMAVVGDLWRASETVRQGVVENWGRYELDLPMADVILTLRRQGRGHALSPSQLAGDMMLSTSAMTNRLDRLEKRGLIERRPDPEDRRGLKIVLTDEGFALADDVVVTHVETEERLLGGLSTQERDQLRGLLQKLMD